MLVPVPVAPAMAGRQLLALRRLPAASFSVSGDGARSAGTVWDGSQRSPC